MKKHLVWINILLFVALSVGAYYSPTTFWQPLLINMATTFFAICLGLVVINIYLEKAQRKGAIRSLLHLCNNAIANFHNTFLDLIWTKFGKNEFGDLRNAYMKAGGDPKTLPPETREKLYLLATTKQNELSILIQSLEESLAEVTRLVGWDLDADLLSECLKARTAIRHFREVKLDGSDKAKEDISEHLIDIDCFSQYARDKLLELAGIKQEG